MAIKRLNGFNRPRYVVDQILSSIQDGSLRAGERLPSEAKLAELTGVGRTSVREALAALRLMGVVETRVGDGSYVREVASFEGVSNGIAQAIEQSEEARHLQEARAAVEISIVQLAVALWSPGSEERLKRLLLEMGETAQAEGYERYVQLHRDFHLALAEATGNPILVQTERSFLEYMDHEGWQDMERQFLLPNRREILKESVEEHKTIVEAISNGDAVAAGERMRKHFARYEGVGDGS